MVSRSSLTSNQKCLSFFDVTYLNRLVTRLNFGRNWDKSSVAKLFTSIMQWRTQATNILAKLASVQKCISWCASWTCRTSSVGSLPRPVPLLMPLGWQQMQQLCSTCSNSRLDIKRWQFAPTEKLDLVCIELHQDTYHLVCWSMSHLLCHLKNVSYVSQSYKLNLINNIIIHLYFNYYHLKTM